MMDEGAGFVIHIGPPAYATEFTPPAAAGADTQVRASVIIVNYNGRDYLEVCLSSLFYSITPDDEILLIDNASTDGSAEYVEQAFPQVWVIRNSSNQGFGQASNQAARRAAGRYLVFLNPDTKVDPYWLEAMVEALENNPQAGLATSRILLMASPDRINTCGNEMHYTGLTLCRGMGMGRGAFDEAGEVGAISGAAFAVRREVFEEIGGFDERFFLYMEDTDLSWRARLAGYKCFYAPRSIVYHDYTLRFGPQKTFYQERNRYLILLKSLNWPTLIALLPALLLAELVTWGFVLLRERKRLANKLRAYAWIVAHWSQVMRSRRQVQAVRRVRDRDLIAQCTYRLAYEQLVGGSIGRVARMVFNPLFFAFHKLALAVIWW